MKTIGLIGGMSWESTVPYYQIINRTIAEKLGGLHSARIILYSVDFFEIEQLQHEGRWEETGSILADAAQRLEKAGASFLVLCTNTMHKVASDIESLTSIPLLHIADATAKVIKDSGLSCVGLLGTRFTMQQDFYKGRLENIHGISVLTPGEEDQDTVHRIIYEELCLGRILETSRTKYRDIIEKLVLAGAQGIILGCTEIPMLVHLEDAHVPLFDTTEIHARAAAIETLNEAGYS